MSGLKPGTNYTFRVWAVNANNVQGATVSTTTTCYGPVQYISDTHIAPTGVGNGSLATTAVTNSVIVPATITNSRTNISSSFNSYSVAAGAFQAVANTTGYRQFLPSMYSDSAYYFQLYGMSSAGGLTGAALACKNIDTATRTLYIDQYNLLL